MKTLLYVDCCIRREQSRTRKLAESFLGNLPEGWQVEKVVLMDEPLLPLMEGGFAQRDELLQRGDFTHRRFDYAWQFQQADAILIAAPFYDNCRARSMTFLTSRGGFYENSPDEMGSRYMEALCGFFGTGTYRCVAADGVDMDPAQTPGIIAEACERAAQAAKEL